MSMVKQQREKLHKKARKDVLKSIRELINIVMPTSRLITEVWNTRSRPDEDCGWH